MQFFRQRGGATQFAKAWGWREAALIFALALVPRLIHWWFVRTTPLAGEFVPDLSAYLFAVQRIMNSAYFFLDPMVMSPGYALVLAPQYLLLGPDVPMFVLVNAVLDAASAALCAGLAAQVAGPVAASDIAQVAGLDAGPGLQRRVGFMAGILYALCGPLLFYALLPLGEGPSIFCLLLGLTLLFSIGSGDPSARASAPLNPGAPNAANETGSPNTGGAPQKLDIPNGGALQAWLAGVLFALAALIRPNLAPALLLALGVWGAFTLWRAKRGPERSRVASLAARCLLGLFLALSPFMAHNAVVAGRPSPFGFQGGFTLYTGNHPGASGVGDALPGFENTPYMVLMQAWQRAEAESGRQLSLAGADAWWYGKAWRFFAENPGEAAALLGRKALLLVNNNGLDATANMDFCARFSPVPGLLALPVGLVFALGAAGLGLAWRRSPQAAALAALLLAQVGLVLLFQVTPRYRVVLLPLAAIFGAIACAELPGLLRQGLRCGFQWRRTVLLVAPILAAGLVLGLSLIPLRSLVDKPGMAAQQHAQLAHYYLLRGPQALAQVEFRAALALGAPEPKALKAGLAASERLSGQDATPRPFP